MPKKILRDICLIKYRKFPLRDFEKEIDNEIFFYPKTYSHYWLKLNHKTDNNLTNELATEITKLYQNLNIEDLIFFGDFNRNWISKYTQERIDFKPLIDSVNYFKSHKITNRFNGAVKVNISELNEFLTHFYVLTRCDAEFVHYHFLDEKQNLLGFIHYSGEIRFDSLNAKTDELFLKKIIQTKFLDTFRENTNRI